jgi:uncharacterized membrane protein
MIPKQRLDALTDGVFAVAMTLLVIDLRLPAGFHPQDGVDLLHGLAGLGNQALVYVVSFYVLALRWFGLVRSATRREEVSERYARWAVINLLIVTMVPFATMVVGRYPSLAPAVWLYSATITLMGVLALRMVVLEEPDPTVAREARLGLSILIAAATLTIVLSFIAPRWALLAYVANLIDEPLRRLRKRAGR